MKKLFTLLGTVMLGGCTGLPENVTPVSGFNTNNYLGRWYEIARLDHSFERGLSDVTAHYSLRPDGGIKVVNCGYSAKHRAWRQAEGKAYFVRTADEGHLKVSFFGPFYGSYVIFALDKPEYQYAYVAGPSKDYLWFLSRTPAVTGQQFQQFEQQARSLGFDTSKLIRVTQSRRQCPTSPSPARDL